MDLWKKYESKQYPDNGVFEAVLVTDRNLHAVANSLGATVIVQAPDWNAIEIPGEYPVYVRSGFWVIRRDSKDRNPRVYPGIIWERYFKRVIESDE